MKRNSNKIPILSHASLFFDFVYERWSCELREICQVREISMTQIWSWWRSSESGTLFFKKTSFGNRSVVGNGLPFERRKEMLLAESSTRERERERERGKGRGCLRCWYGKNFCLLYEMDIYIYIYILDYYGFQFFFYKTAILKLCNVTNLPSLFLLIFPHFFLDFLNIKE
jgi:hypothetical protein